MTDLDLLTTHEAAALLRCCERYVKNELRAKNLRGSKIAGQWLIERADLDTYIEANANVSRVLRRLTT